MNISSRAPHSPSMAECFRRYRAELSAQLDFLGANIIDPEDLIEAYFRLRGMKRIKALSLIFERDDRGGVMNRVISRTTHMVVSKNPKVRKSGTLRMQEIREAIQARPEVQNAELRSLMHFAESFISSSERRKGL